MVRRLIIHAGMPRAGSSTIQEALYRQRKKLEAVGLLYPALDLRHSSDGKPGQVYNHRQLCESGKGLWLARRFHELHGEIAEAILASPARHIVLSYEGWWDPRNHASLKRTLKALHAKVPELALTIGAMVRDPADFLLSLYKLDVLHGRTMALFEDYWPGKLGEPRLRYAEIADAFESIAEKLCFVRFGEAAKGGRLVGHALDAWGLEGFYRRAGVAHLERHRSPGGVYFSDAVITMMRFAASELGQDRLARDRVPLMRLMHELSRREDLRADCESLIIPINQKATAAITTATSRQSQVFYSRYLKIDVPPPLSCDGRLQSDIGRYTALGRAITAALQTI